MSKLTTLSVLFAIASVTSATAATALSFTGGNSAVGSVVTDGWAFTLSSSTQITDLGIFDLSGDGLGSSHEVGIWTGTGTLQATVTLPAGTSAVLLNGFRYTAISPVTLPAGDYTIGAFYDGSIGGDSLILGAVSITTAAGITYRGSRSTGGSGLTFPTTDTTGPFANSYFGPNFQAAVVPEPVSGSLMLIACTVAVCSSRRRRAGAGSVG